MKKILLIILLLSFSAHAEPLTDAIATSISIPAKIDVHRAQKLASEAVFGSDKRALSFDYDSDDGGNSAFYEFGGLNSKGGVFGYFAVNKWTGDVWSLWRCEEISTPASRKDQAQIRTLFTPDEMKQYKQLAAIKAACWKTDSDDGK